MNKRTHLSLFLLKKDKGFTLVETLVAIVIFGLITVVLFNGIAHLYQVYAFGWEQTQAIDEARRGMKIMLEESRGVVTGDDGSYPIVKAGDNELIFFSNIDDDEDIERVRYFLGSDRSREQTKDCVSFSQGGTCSVVFSDFYSGTLSQARVQVSIEGDFGWAGWETAEVLADGIKLDDFCVDWGDCGDCAGQWEDIKTFDVTQQAQDNEIQFDADASHYVDRSCNWEDRRHSMKVRFVLTWIEQVPSQDREFKKGVIDPIGSPKEYPVAQEKIKILSNYVQNFSEGEQAYVFKYFDKQGDEILNIADRIDQTRLIKFSLIINVNPVKTPSNYKLESAAQLRNLKIEED